MTQKFVTRIYDAWLTGCKVKHGRYTYNIKYFPTDTPEKWEPWVIRCPSGRENVQFLTPNGQVTSHWEKIVKL